MYLKYIQCAKMCKNVEKRGKTCKNVYLKYLITKKRASQGLIFEKACKNVQKTCKNVQKRSKTFKNVYLKCFWTLFKTVHCQGPCILRPCISRPYCTINLICQNIYQFKSISVIWLNSFRSVVCLQLIKQY